MMSWRIRWRREDEHKTYTFVGDEVVFWSDDSGQVLLEMPTSGWEWATLAEEAESRRALLRWHEPPDGVEVRRQAKHRAPEGPGRHRWYVGPGDEIRFPETDTTIEIVATGAAADGVLRSVERTEAETELDPDCIKAMWELHKKIANGKGWQQVLDRFGEMTRELVGLQEIVMSGALIWERRRQTYHQILGPQRPEDSIGGESKAPQSGPGANLVSWSDELQEGIQERGEVVVRHRGEECVDVFFPISGQDVLGAFYVMGTAASPLEAKALWALTRLFNSTGVELVRRHQNQKQREDLEEENRYFRQRERRHYLFKDLVCESDVMRDVYDELHDRADEETPILLTGESGTGKELLARALHHLGERQESMLIRMGCADFPRELVNFELFGCVPSELTGVAAPRKGIFELAQGGTVFLDEIDRLSPMVQGKLVGLLQQGKVRRTGDIRQRAVDLRFVASTHRDLERLCEGGQFRPDLYELLIEYRLEVPPLRSRSADILPLARIFLKKFSTRYGARCQTMDEKLQQWLISYAWPGNVRQLQAFMEAAVLMARDKEVINHQKLLVGAVDLESDQVSVGAG